MQLLPHLAFEINSPLSLAEAEAALTSQLVPRRPLRLRSAAHLFEGELNGGELRCRRVISYRNAFRPEVSALLKPDSGGARLVGQMKLHSRVALFMAVWCGVVVLIGGPLTIVMAVSPGERLWALLPPAMLLGAWAVTFGSFTFEARRALAALRSLLHAPPGKGAHRAA